MISSFYQGKSILIVGATGGLGKVILEKILRTFPNVKNIYITVRDKKNVGKSIDSPDDLYNYYKSEIKDSQVFDRLKIQIGPKSWRVLLKDKIKILPLDFTK